jgi:hypothetical protein
MERSAIREVEVPGFAALHPGYKRRFINISFTIVARRHDWRAHKKIFADYQP